jgi:hypothetical protein
MNIVSLLHLREKLEAGKYERKDMVPVWRVIDELIDLRTFRDQAFRAHPNLDRDIENLYVHKTS